MMTRVAIGLGMAALLVPVSLMLGLSPGKSIFVSIMIALVFMGLTDAMTKLFRKRDS